MFRSLRNNVSFSKRYFSSSNGKDPWQQYKDNQIFINDLIFRSYLMNCFVAGCTFGTGVGWLLSMFYK